MPPIRVLFVRQLLIIMLSTGSPSSDKTKEKTERDNEVVVIAFFGTSCMGKSELVHFMRQRGEEDNTTVVDVNKDTVARPLMDAYYAEHPDLPFEDVYMNIYGQVTEKFVDEAFRALRNLAPGRNIVVLDDAWANEKLLQRIATEDVAPGYKKRMICVYPKMPDKSLYSSLPFSLQFIVNLLYRVVQRKDHPTMVYDDVKKIQIVISFLKLYSNIRSIPEKFKEDIPFEEFYALEFHQESDIAHGDERMPQTVSEIYKQIEVCFEKMGAPFESPLVTGKPEFERLSHLINKLIENKGHTTQKNFINYGRKSEWENWYNVLFPC